MVLKNHSKRIFEKLLTKKSCDKDAFHPSRHAAVLYTVQSPAWPPWPHWPFIYTILWNFLIKKIASCTGAVNICLFSNAIVCWDEQNIESLVTKLKLWQNLKTQIVAKLKKSNCDKTQKLKLWSHSKTTIVTEIEETNL